MSTIEPRSTMNQAKTAVALGIVALSLATGGPVLAGPAAGADKAAAGADKAVAGADKAVAGADKTPAGTEAAGKTAATADSTGKNGGLHQSMTVEGEDRIQVQFQRPAL